MIPWSSLSEVGCLNPVAPQPAIITPSDTSWWWFQYHLHTKTNKIEDFKQI